VNFVVFQVFKEALRLFPPVPIHFREAIKEIDLGQVHIVLVGALIWMPAYVIHRDPKHFPEPEKFDTDRFSPQNSAGRHPYAYTPFGIGRRMCVGHVFATMEAKTVLSTVLRRYWVTAVEGGIRGLEETLKLSFVMSNANGIRVKLLTRSHQS
jgi:cytochrome P450 family 4